MKQLFGNAVVGQSGGPTAAINATLAGVIRGVKKTTYIHTLYGMRNGVEGLMREDLIDLSAYFEGEKNKDVIVGDNGYVTLCESCLRKRRKNNEE